MGNWCSYMLWWRVGTSSKFQESDLKGFKKSKIVLVLASL